MPLFSEVVPERAPQSRPWILNSTGGISDFDMCLAVASSYPPPQRPCKEVRVFKVGIVKFVRCVFLTTWLSGSPMLVPQPCHRQNISRTVGVSLFCVRTLGFSGISKIFERWWSPTDNIYSIVWEMMLCQTPTFRWTFQGSSPTFATSENSLVC